MLVLILAAILAVSPAQASKPTLVQQAASKWIAQLRWGQTRCRDVHLSFQRDPAWARQGWAYTPPGNGCWVLFDRHWPWRGQPALFCSALTHEWGHIAGYGHSDNPNDLMFYRFVPWPPCYALFGR